MITKKYTSGLLLILSCTFTAFSQKLPEKQETGVYASSNVKLDGKITEWGNLQAYNPATEISYTMANDDNNLYFVCSSIIPETIQKIQLSGITLTISPVDKKSVVEPVAITYPIVPWVNVQINYDLREKAPLKESLVSTINDKISGYLKEIKISGVKDFPEGSIPVYNDKGIVGGHYISKDKVYTYELSFPLSLIRSLLNDKDTFNYKVQVNGMGKDVITVGGVGPGMSAPSDKPAQPGASYNTAPTYFNATYTLSKK
ncbi:MAG: hypothetical protein EOP47_08390 [Sphingobacteriaceae bacterium]|nr:MAG: hypothetical protein EOP47_08390 [Sphingobacteriaceae bacterium]